LHNRDKVIIIVLSLVTWGSARDVRTANVS
jgi:hypothetical protein